MRRYDRKASDADIRRWQCKWKDRNAALLTEATARKAMQEAPKPQRTASGTNRSGGIGAFAAMELDIAKMYDSPVNRMVRDIENSSTMRFMREVENSPTMRFIREIENNPVMRLQRQIENSPVMKLIREQERINRMLNPFGGASGLF